MARTTTQGIIGLDTNYVGMTAHGPMRVGDVLARFERAEEAVLYAGSRLVTLDKNNAKRAGDNAPAQPAPVTRAKHNAPVAQPAPEGETRKARNQRLWAMFKASGGELGNRDAWLAFKAAQGDSAPAPVVNPAPVAQPAPVKAARKARKSTANQVAHRAKFAAYVKACAAAKASGLPKPTWADFNAQPAPAPEKPAPVVTVQTVKATPPVTRSRAKAVPAPVVEAPAVKVTREIHAAQDTSDAAILDWILAQPEPLRVGMRDLAGQFPTVSNNRKLAALAEIKALAA